MSARKCLVILLTASAALTACAKTQVTDRQVLVDEKVPRPAHIYVYDFATRPADVPAGSALAATPAAPQTPEQEALGQQVGADLANELIAQIAGMGLPALHATDQTQPEVNDLVIRGYLLSVETGNEAERVAIGMGKGAAELRVAVEGFQMTPQGLRKLGSGTVDTNASKTPGAIVPLAVTLATKNPLGLIVSTGVKLHDEHTGEAKIQGKVKQVAEEIAAQLKPRFQQQGWI
jgi:hypothetical protein